MKSGSRRLAVALRALSIVLGLAVGTLATLQIGLAAGAAAQDGRPTPGQHIYDTTGLLTATEISTLEQHASAVEQAGAPCVVYLQAKSATQDQTLQDAGNLMNRWDIESAAGAQDGFVMFFNLEPGNLRHGQVTLFAGKKWYDSSLPQNETQRIYNDVMLPSLKDGNTAQAIADGLDAVAHDLQYGLPKPSAAQQAFQSFGRVPFNVLSLLYVLTLIVGALRAVRSEPPHSDVEPRATPPGDLAPAIVGALLRNNISDAHMEGTVLDLARRGLITIGPNEDDDVYIRLTEKKADLTGYEETVWSGIVAAANGNDDVTHKHMPDIRNTWATAKSELHAALIQRGWLEAHDESRRTLLYGIGAAGIIGACLGVIVALIAQEGWAVIGVLVLLFGAIVAFAFGHSISEITPEGEAAAAPWRGYARVLQTGYPQLSNEELDVALPYAVAMGYRDEIGRALQAAGDAGHAYSPSWFRPQQSGQSGLRGGLGFYPYWIGWHSAMYPPPSSSGSGGGGFSGGGAAGGGGGGGGGF